MALPCKGPGLLSPFYSITRHTWLPACDLVPQIVAPASRLEGEREDKPILFKGRTQNFHIQLPFLSHGQLAGRKTGKCSILLENRSSAIIQGFHY